jgi:hypothetical protein
MVNYSNSKIYKLVCSESDKIYIGSTTRNINRRFIEHSRPYTNLKNECSSKELIKPFIILLEEYNCNNLNELRLRERYHIENNPNCVNKKIPGRTEEEWRENNKAYTKEKNKQWRETHKKESLEIITCSCGEIIKKCSVYRHEKTKKHLRKLQLLN